MGSVTICVSGLKTVVLEGAARIGLVGSYSGKKLTINLQATAYTYAWKLGFPEVNQSPPGLLAHP